MECKKTQDECAGDSMHQKEKEISKSDSQICQITYYRENKWAEFS